MRRPVVHVVYYSMYGHIKSLAQRAVKGLESTGKVEVKLYQFRETLPSDILEKLHAPPKDESVPVYTPDEMAKADAYMFGIPSRFGTLPAQVKTFIDSLGQLWLSGALVGKMSTVFFSSGSQGGGMETVPLSYIINASHLGMIYVPLGPNKANSNMGQIVGGSAYGAGTFAGLDGSRTPTESELETAYKQAEYFANTVAKFSS
ncbi:NAD(P)H dehydrogenase (quinone) FQR1 [Zancudomyces culisetae]|uniref:NAD(P)H dehydrogenase (Quinone) FQR1 n=1 Tax=Zancudomyces culisetae TaxID=1213189 RepID=A0A1R1PGG9_ZANCU|nr:NAD(P)H dehydrogenase (quinone) FQR1 [Zancudomyces culisetae]|eukprot:OMH80028.1 NAD(P)H dehydrogenase (quinone) FQR1 [Zancudomyces culisetae]